jgi:hypothetical protein
MKTLVRHLCLSLLAAGAAGAFAGTEAGAGQVVEITAPPPALAAAQAVLASRHFESTYGMSTGRRLVVSAQGDALRVQYGRRLPATLKHDGQGRFVSHDGQLSLQFAPDAGSDTEHVRLTMPAGWL